MKNINSNLNEKCGVYIITNIINGKRYIGSSKNLKERLQKHVWDLNKRVHINEHLQSAWNKYGEDAFDYGIIELTTEDTRFDREQYYIDILNPEYNLDKDVKHITRTNNTKEKISDTLLKKYANGYTNASKNTEFVYVYNILTWELIKECSHLSEAGSLLYNKSSTLKSFQIDSSIINKKFVVLSKKFANVLELKNFVSKNILNYKTQDGRLTYLIIDDGELHYFKTTQNAVDFMKCSSVSTLKKHMNSTINTPYQIPNTKFKMYLSDTYIQIRESQHREESL